MIALAHPVDEAPAQRPGLLRGESRRACPLCGSSGISLHAGVEDPLFGVPGRWNLRRCSADDCRLVWQDPMVIDADLPLAYREYYTHAGAGLPSAMRTAMPDRRFFELDRWFTRLLRLQPARDRHAAAYLHDAPAGALLDVGCGNGQYLADMQARGWSVRGTELDPEAAATATRLHGIPVDVGQLPALAYPAASFDAVTARHVVEHVRDARDFVAECWRILKPGGRLVLVTPNADSLGHRHFGVHWRGLEQPRHLFLYGPVAMQALLHRAGLPAAQPFSTAQGAAYILRSSLAGKAAQAPRARPFAQASIWWLLCREVAAIRRGVQTGEELVAVVRKPG
jgi:2-polyprenyl-3-methyl-5-hydroxy-6-metoxy-1,4-benzoquinol methylase